jgi:beta-lactamase regulating signal transducer with metallopeptidase domain
MNEPIWIALAALAVFFVYVVARIIGYVRQSDAQWRQVDKSQLKEWQDDD